MEEGIVREIVDYFISIGYDKEEAWKIAYNHSESIIEALNIQLDVELAFLREQIINEEG